MTEYTTITEYFEKFAPADLRDLVKNAGKDDILSDDFPYDTQMKSKEYDAQMESLQIQLVKMQNTLRSSGQRVAIVFEGRDAAGKGGTIKSLNYNLNPRSARVVALSKPSDMEKSQWYFQRYIQHLPSAGEIVSFDRSWYNRGVLEPVFGFCTTEERDTFLDQTIKFEQMLVEDGVILIKFWLTVSRGEQLRRFLARENDPLKQWKISPIDIAGLTKWDEYSTAIDFMLERTDKKRTPWTVLRSDDKKRVRLEVTKHVLSQIEFDGRDTSLLAPDPKIFKIQ